MIFTLILVSVCASGIYSYPAPLQNPIHRVKRGGLVGTYGGGLGDYSGFSSYNGLGPKGGGGAAGAGGGTGAGNLVIAGAAGTRHGSTASDVANQAAGVAASGAAYQQQAAWNAADQASQQVAKQAAAAANQAQAAAATNYAQSAAVSHAALQATRAAFEESANAAQAAQTVESAEAFKRWALDQANALGAARAYAEGNVALSHNLISATQNALGTQAAMEWSARQAAAALATQEGISMNDLQSAQNAANLASSAAKTAYLRAKGTGHSGLGIATASAYGAANYGGGYGHRR